MIFVRLVAVLALMTSGVAFAQSPGMDPVPPSQPGMEPGMHPGMDQGMKDKTGKDMKMKALEDGELARVLGLASQNATDLAELASRRAQNAQVKTYAQTVIDDHEELDRKLVSAIRNNDIRGKDSEKAQKLGRKHTEARNELMGLNGMEFDRAYLDHEIENNEMMLGLIDANLGGDQRVGAVGDATMDPADPADPAMGDPADGDMAANDPMDDMKGGDLPTDDGLSKAGTEQPASRSGTGQMKKASGKLDSVLQEARTTLQGHLDEARRIKATLSTTVGADTNRQDDTNAVTPAGTERDVPVDDRGEDPSVDDRTEDPTVDDRGDDAIQ